MEMKQMVYVVIDNDGVTGVWNEYKDAEAHVSEDGVIVPVIVDQYGHRDGCETPSEVVTAMEKELQNLYSTVSKFVDNDEEEDEDEYDDDDEYEDEDEEDDEYNDDDENEEDYYDDDDDEDEHDDIEKLTESDKDIIRGLLDMFLS